IALIGSWTWKANSEGLKWFLEKVYPLLPPDVAIHVAGSGAQWLVGLYENLRYVGFVDDAQTFLRGAKVVAIPTLSGGGIQIKTLDAIASGSRIVATPLALRGIEDYPETISVAGTDEQFAALLRSAVTTPASVVASAKAVEWTVLRNQNFRRDLAESIGELLRGRAIA
ncbi:MAG: glycosyltransferase family 4 protein, partial [Pseudonocardiaceae bacterium]